VLYGNTIPDKREWRLFTNAS